MYATLAKTEHDRGNVEKSIDYWTRSMSYLEELGREHAIAETWNNLALALIDRGQIRRAQEALSRARDLGESVGHGRLVPWLELTKARIALREDRFAEAERIASSVAHDAAATDRARTESLLVLALALSAQRSSASRVSRAYEDALAAATSQPPGCRSRILRLYAEALASLGETATALEKMRQALELIRPSARVS